MSSASISKTAIESPANDQNGDFENVHCFQICLPNHSTDGGLVVKKTRFGFVSLIVFILGGLLIPGAQGKEPIKIAIASDGETIDSQVGEKAARCRWLLFFDEEGKLTETLENPYRDERGGAGTKCAELLAENKITIFVADFVGNKMAAALERSNITFVSFTGAVKDAVAHVLGDLTEIRKNTWLVAPAGSCLVSPRILLDFCRPR